MLNIAEDLKAILAEFSGKKPEDVNHDNVDKHLYDIIEQEGTAGRVYLRSVDTLKCLVLKDCPVDVETYKATITDYTEKGAEQIQITVTK